MFCEWIQLIVKFLVNRFNTKSTCLLIDITQFDINMHNIIHIYITLFKLLWGGSIHKYDVEYCQSQGTLLWI